MSSNDGNIFGIPKEDSTELPLNGFPQTAKFQKIYQKIFFFCLLKFAFSLVGTGKDKIKNC